MTAPVLTPGALTPELCARAVVQAGRLLKIDPATCFEKVADGRGRVRLLAAAALIHPADRPVKASARVMAVHPNSLAPSALVNRGIYSNMVADVRRAVFTPPVPKGVDLKRPEDAKRGEDDWIDPRRQVEREQRIIAARKAGTGPAQIARDEQVNVTTVYRILNRHPGPFPSLKTGPRPKIGKASAAPTASKTRTPRASTRVAASRLKPAPAPVVAPAPPPEPVEAFPADHPAWAPLPGTTPRRLVDHKDGCRWPVEVPGAREPMVCDSRIIAGSPYCERHRWLAASPAIRSTLTRPADLPPSFRVARSADADIAREPADA